ncbi:hypothetical protein SK128_010210 [Halocaridina rubra]|uniref:Uncharacterized protein n=1 Tax=Halocaridina rubra TaxID=373956 RepID=A0AAN8WG84_HALRR
MKMINPLYESLSDFGQRSLDVKSDLSSRSLEGASDSASSHYSVLCRPNSVPPREPSDPIYDVPPRPTSCIYDVPPRVPLSCSLRDQERTASHFEAYSNSLSSKSPSPSNFSDEEPLYDVPRAHSLTPLLRNEQLPMAGYGQEHYLPNYYSSFDRNRHNTVDSLNLLRNKHPHFYSYADTYKDGYIKNCNRKNSRQLPTIPSYTSNAERNGPFSPNFTVSPWSKAPFAKNLFNKPLGSYCSPSAPLVHCDYETVFNATTHQVDSSFDVSLLSIANSNNHSIRVKNDQINERKYVEENGNMSYVESNIKLLNHSSLTNAVHHESAEGEGGLIKEIDEKKDVFTEAPQAHIRNDSGSWYDADQSWSDSGVSSAQDPSLTELGLGYDCDVSWNENCHDNRLLEHGHQTFKYINGDPQEKLEESGKYSDLHGTPLWLRRVKRAKRNYQKAKVNRIIQKQNVEWASGAKSLNNKSYNSVTVLNNVWSDSGIVWRCNPLWVDEDEDSDEDSEIEDYESLEANVSETNVNWRPDVRVGFERLVMSVGLCFGNYLKEQPPLHPSHVLPISLALRKEVKYQGHVDSTRLSENLVMHDSVVISLVINN